MENPLLIRTPCVLFIACLFFISGVANAQVKKYFPNFDAFPEAVLLSEKASVGKSPYRLPLGTLKRKEGSLHPEYEKKLIGEVTHLTYEIKRDYSPSEVFHHYLDFFIEREQYQTLYHCESRACGSNSHWANKIFSQKVLNGLVDTQRYVALRAPSASKVDYIALYFVQRGNKKNYLHLDFIDIEDSLGGEEQDFSRLSTAGFVVLKGLVFSSSGELNIERSQSVLDDLLQWISQNPEQGFTLVAHSKPRGDIAVALKQSAYAADSVLTYVKSKIAKLGSGLHAHGIGPLAPRYPQIENLDYWVELIKLPS
ncbi:MAG: DUF4892 domain-containing protein [Pseudomonadales bacterium]|nr:DUF4892 domain-containing protein [Pseudomonadales bacterium]